LANTYGAKQLLVDIARGPKLAAHGNFVQLRVLFALIYDHWELLCSQLVYRLVDSIPLGITHPEGVVFVVKHGLSRGSLLRLGDRIQRFIPLNTRFILFSSALNAVDAQTSLRLIQGLVQVKRHRSRSLI